MPVFCSKLIVLPTFISTVNITADNITKYFQVANSYYCFYGNGSVFTTNNGGVEDSTAQTTLTALFDMDVSFDYSYSSESGYDKFTLTFSGTTVENQASGDGRNSYSGKLTKGQTIVLTYKKDGSQDGNNDQCTFSNMVITGDFMGVTT